MIGYRRLAIGFFICMVIIGDHHLVDDVGFEPFLETPELRVFEKV